MKIISVELSGYIRVSLNNIEYIKYTPSEDIQLILGTNGSGKSSLMHELSPLPANVNEYKRGGYKRITLERNNKTYVLTNSFGAKQEHTFERDGENLNKSMSITVQRELIKQEFGYTQLIHDLNLNKIGFSDMDASTRRTWFTRLSDVNYEYAISVYLKLKEKSRDVSGALKLAKKRLTIETSKVITLEEQTEIQRQVDDLYLFVEHLSTYRVVDKFDLSHLKLELSDIEKELGKLNSIIIKKKSSLNNQLQFTSKEDIDKEINKLENILSVENILLEKNLESFNGFKETIELLKATGNNNLKELETEIITLNNQVNNVSERLKLKLAVDKPIETLKALETVYDILSSVFNELPDNSDRRFTRNKLEETYNFILVTKDKITKLNNQLSYLTNQKTHLEHKRDNTKLDCPKCLHSWYKDYDPAVFENVCKQLELVTNELDELTTGLVEQELYLEQIKEYSNTYKSYTSCVNNWPILSPLWDYLNSSSYVTNYPKKALVVVEAFIYDLKLLACIEDINEKIQDKNNIISLLKKTDNEDMSKVSQSLSLIEESINKNTLIINTASLKLRTLVNYKKDTDYLIDLGLKIQNNLCQHDVVTKRAIENIRLQALNDIIRMVQSTLSKKEQVLNEIKLQKAVINDLENQIEAMQMDDEVYKVLVKELSPTEGLIAQGLLGFISSFTNQMNSFIKKIWHYPLSIVPCGISDGDVVELDYKFPILVGEDENLFSDVSKGSSAMKEIFDLAFKITGTKYLGLSDAPLLLDEFGHSFDPAHRDTATEIIKTLVDTGVCNQLFLISHYENNYSSLTNAEVCVLCDNNIVIPKGSVYNQHVVFN